MRTTICDICKQRIDIERKEREEKTRNFRLSLIPIEYRYDALTGKEEYSEYQNLDICCECAKELVEAVKKRRNFL